MGWMAAAAPIAMQGIQSFTGGSTEAATNQEKGLELRQQAALVRTQAQEQQASRLDTLNRTVGAITAITSSRNLNVDSASAQAVTGQRKQTAKTDVATIGANAAVQSGILSEEAQAALNAAKQAQMMATLFSPIPFAQLKLL